MPERAMRSIERVKPQLVGRISTNINLDDPKLRRLL
jgi:hypothetical protein